MLGEISLGGDLSGGFGTEIGKSSFASVVGSLTTATEVFFLNWSICLLTLLPSVRSTVNEEGPVLQCITPESHGSLGLKFLTKTESPSTNSRSLA